MNSDPPANPERPRPLPANTEIEQSLLGSILMNNATYERVAAILRPEDFANGVHGRIYAIAGEIIERGQPADTVTLQTYFSSDPALSPAGGVAYLGRLVEAAGLAVNARHYAQTLVDLARRRALIVACQDAIEDAYAPDVERPVGAVIEQHEQQLYELSETRDGGVGPVPMRTAVNESLRLTEAAYQAGGKIVGVETGLVDLDRMIGGLQRGNLEILAGRPSMGKSALSAGVALHVAMRQGVPSVIFSLEETRAQQAQRWLASRSGVPSDRQRRGDLDVVLWQSLSEAASCLASLSIVIDDTPALLIGEIRRRARRLKRTHNIGLVIVDHLQLVSVPGRNDRNNEIGIITRGLKQLAKELDVPVLCLSQLSRAVEQRENKRPVLSDLRDSGNVEQDADGVFFLYRAEYYLQRDEPGRRPDENDEKFNDRYDRWKHACEDACGLAEVIVAKRRNGPIGTVRVRWDGSLTKFDNLAKHERGAY